MHRVSVEREARKVRVTARTGTGIGRRCRLVRRITATTGDIRRAVVAGARICGVDCISALACCGATRAGCAAAGSGEVTLFSLDAGLVDSSASFYYGTALRFTLRPPVHAARP
eukprot:4174179-Prymnesium_polylepis.1